MFTAYNIRRLINILGKNKLQKFFQELALLLFRKTTPAKAISFKIRHSVFTNWFCQYFNTRCEIASN